jgi:exodeoxyribonuclease V
MAEKESKPIELTAVELTPQQEKAAYAIKDWFSGSHLGPSQTFTLAGYAGTGKTYLIDYVIEFVLGLKPMQVAFAAPTGKAAMVLVQKGRDAHTIHHLIYHEIEDKYIVMQGGRPTVRTRLRFAKNKSLPPEYKLIVVDEVSMVSQEMMDDILSFGLPVLCSGDSGQLEPVAANMNSLIRHPDATLTEIVRQKADSPIIRMSADARAGMVGASDYGQAARMVRRCSMSQDDYYSLLCGADQVICGTNATRRSLNVAIRQRLGRNSILPEEGDKIICCANDYSIPIGTGLGLFLVNGCLGKLTSYEEAKGGKDLCVIGFMPDFLNEATEGILADSGAFLRGGFSYDQMQQAYLMKDGSYELAAEYQKRMPGESQAMFAQRAKAETILRRRSVSRERVNEFDYGYAISCHKSQGSEFGRVVVIDESRVFRDKRDKWLYTAITRAKDSIVIIEP